jgi:hypothetical protein
MEEEYQAVRDFLNENKDPVLTLTMHLRLAWVRCPRHWFTLEMRQHMESIAHLNEWLPQEKRDLHAQRAINLLLANGQLKETIDCIANLRFSFDAAILGTMQLMNPYAVQLCFSSRTVYFDPELIGELADWLIGNFSHQDPRLFVGFFTERDGDPMVLAKIINHVPEVLQHLGDGRLATTSRLVVEAVLCHGMGHKLCLTPLASDKELLSLIVESKLKDAVTKNRLVDYLPDAMGTDLEACDHTLQEHWSFFEITKKALGGTEREKLENVDSLQSLYETDPRCVIGAVIFRSSSKTWCASREVAEWFVSHFNNEHRILFSKVFLACSDVESARYVLEHAPLLLTCIKNWQICYRNRLLPLLAEYGACHKIIPEPGNQEDYNQALKVNDYISDELKGTPSNESNILILETRYPLPPHTLAWILGNKFKGELLESYLNAQPETYRQDFKACCDLLY